MSDNNRFVIRKAQVISDCRECPHENEDCEPDCVCPMEKGKTRAEYEAMIAETLWNKHYKVYLKTYKEALGVHDSLIQCAMDTVHGLAKAVVDRLFGERE